MGGASILFYTAQLYRLVFFLSISLLFSKNCVSKGNNNIQIYQGFFGRRRSSDAHQPPEEFLSAPCVYLCSDFHPKLADGMLISPVDQIACPRIYSLHGLEPGKCLKHGIPAHNSEEFVIIKQTQFSNSDITGYRVTSQGDVSRDRYKYHRFPRIKICTLLAFTNT